MVAFVDVCNALFVTFVGAPLYFGAHVCLYAYELFATPNNSRYDFSRKHAHNEYVYKNVIVMEVEFDGHPCHLRIRNTNLFITKATTDFLKKNEMEEPPFK